MKFVLYSNLVLAISLLGCENNDGPVKAPSFIEYEFDEELSNDDTLVSLNEVFNDWEAYTRTV